MFTSFEMCKFDWWKSRSSSVKRNINTYTNEHAVVSYQKKVIWKELANSLTLPWILFFLIPKRYCKLCCHPNVHFLTGCHQQSVWNCVLMSTALMEPLVQFQLMRGNRWNWAGRWKGISPKSDLLIGKFCFDAFKNYMEKSMKPIIKADDVHLRW